MNIHLHEEKNKNNLSFHNKTHNSTNINNSYNKNQRFNNRKE